MYEEEYLAHYGVKGMRWGVRKDLRTLANSRRNKEVRRIKRDYETGKITKDQKVSKINKADADKKKYLEKVKHEYESTNSYSKKMQIEREITKQSMKEVSNRNLKNGARMVNSMLAGYEAGSMIGAGIIASMAVPPMAPLYIASVASSVAGTAGRTWLINKGLDKLS